MTMRVAIEISNWGFWARASEEDAVPLACMLAWDMKVLDRRSQPSSPVLFIVLYPCTDIFHALYTVYQTEGSGYCLIVSNGFLH